MAARTPRKKTEPNDTPMMRQYMGIKDKYPDAILFYRMGDFYEMFFEDAILAAGTLDLALTSRNKNAPDPVPMCGIPHHAAIAYISRLLESGFKIAICEQMEDPSQVKGLVKRDVIRVITPGVVVDEENLDAKSNNYLAAICPVHPEGITPDTAAVSHYALAVMDASTNEFKGTIVAGQATLTGELFRLEPREVLIGADMATPLKGITRMLTDCYVSQVADALLDPKMARTHLEPVLGTDNTASLFGRSQELAMAAGAIIGYIKSTRPLESVPPLRFTPYNIADHMIVDEATKRHLELVKTTDGEKKGALLWLLDQTATPMGGRLLRHWINYPLFNIEAINRRLDRVELFFEDTPFRRDVRQTLSGIADIERIAARISMGAASPRDLGVLRNSLFQLPTLKTLIDTRVSPGKVPILKSDFDTGADLAAYLAKALVEDPPLSRTDGGIFKPGFDASLDEYVGLLTTAKDFIAELEAKERHQTGIGSLKVSYNKVFGYFIFVTRPHLKNVPEHYIRKQTLVNGERFITPELEEWENRVLSADEKRKSLEKELFEQLIMHLQRHGDRLVSMAMILGSMDGAAALGEVARQREYSRPTINTRGIVNITDGRHPLVEAVFSDTPFVPNDVCLDVDRERLMIITGPNMAGKSTVMRQVALIAIMAQMGSFVPAKAASLSLTDRVFTRVGASDNIAKGASTFMVEMNETATILKSATRDSLVILDEVGRGTSTYDGLSIAWSVGEYLHDVVSCKTLFATHYHELVELANNIPHAVNFHVAAKEYGDEVVFVRKLVRGGTSHSFGIQVAKMAGLPELVVARAREILHNLEQEEQKNPGTPTLPRAAADTPQLDLFSVIRPSRVEAVLKETDVNRISPLEAMALLARLKDMIDT